MKKAFTLAEVLAVTFIVGLLSSILIVNWRNNEKMYLVQRVAQEIVQNVHGAQSMSLAGKIYDPETVPYFYGVNFKTNDKNNYVIFGDKNGNETYQTPTSDLLIETISVDSNVEIYSLSYVKNGVTTSSNSLDVLFSVPDGFTIINSDSAISSAIIGVRKVGTTCSPAKNCKTITITNTGGITVQ